ncbi:MAG: transcription-repair coupling factor, partial [Defluviitaleaceae bacterium]|nr:transcription-repair coupling factor [Defluviitaleaceae bacterium]
EQCAALQAKDMAKEAQTLQNTMDYTLENWSEELGAQADAFLPFFYEEETNLLDYLPDNTVIFFDDPNPIALHMETVQTEYSESITHRLEAGRLLPQQVGVMMPWAQVLHHSQKFHRVLFSSLSGRLTEFENPQQIPINARSLAPLHHKPSELKQDITKYLKDGYLVAILAGSRRHGQQLAQNINDLDILARFTETLEGTNLAPNLVTVARGTLSAGFEYPDIKLAVITDKELFTGEKKKRRKHRKDKNVEKINHFADLKVGDYIVHDNHGIGIFRGIEQVTSDGHSRDYLKLEYKDGGHIYVQTSQMELIQKYIGGKTEARLSKLGGADWARAKAKARKAVEILAEDLIALYAKRQAAQAHTYGPDTVWQQEFEANFPYTETDDQLTAIEDVKRDMESKRVMDRLVCGDVGYGKTEIAIRAAFKAVQDGKQVAYLVPTTILAEQHYKTFAFRMKEYPITVERLSRFQSKKDQKKTLENMEKGAADIVIGTHRLLSKDVKFRDLGLVIVDEEQRFGVGHKEKLKAMRNNVDVLTLTATPIPRTLHFSLTGIRDMSILDEPPEQRQPIQTYVMEYNPEFVRDAINRELARGGQVYYLHNRVRNIAEEAMRVQQLVPQARVSFAHGQMSETELENIMQDFVEGDIDVLVCTTIIETGLDIPNANTMIIQNADHMGLSQLYQLRGRVGRSSRLAYAYLMYRRDKVLKEEAEKRLQTIREFTEFGAGFKIAMRDLEIRGAGNLLGAEQHGQMDLVGYDMYCKLLAAAVHEIKGEPVDAPREVNIEISVDAHIPARLIPDEQQKLEIYKKISLINSQQDYYDVQEEIEDRFGGLPAPVVNLLDVALMKAKARKLGVATIAQKGLNTVITFRQDASVDLDKLTALIVKNPARLLFTMGDAPYLTVRGFKEDARPDDGGAGKVKEISELLEEIG